MKFSVEELEVSTFWLRYQILFKCFISLDNKNFCTISEQFKPPNNGRCGVCGDNWAEERPRENENGGKYGTGTISEVRKKSDTGFSHLHNPKSLCSRNFQNVKLRPDFVKI